MLPGFDATPRNEIGRLIARCAVADLFGDQHLAVALERAPDGSTAAHCVGDGVPLRARYSIMDLLCRDRAIRAELGVLRVDGRRVPAEKYLAAWRTAPVIPFTELAAQVGQALVYRGEGALADVSDATGHRSDDAVASFAAFRALRPEAVTLSEDGTRFAVTLPLLADADVALARAVHGFLEPWRPDGEPRPDGRGGLVFEAMAPTTASAAADDASNQGSLFAEEVEAAS